MRAKERLPKVPLAAIEVPVWTILIAVAWWWTLTATGDSLRHAIIFSSILSVAFGVRAFLGHGRTGITATGLFSLSSAMFIGYSGIILVQQSIMDTHPRYLALATVAGMTVQVATVALAWGRGKHPMKVGDWLDKKSADWVAGVGLFFLVAAAGADVFVGAGGGAWTEATAFTAICLMAAGLTWRDGARLISFSTILIAAALVVYSEWFHSGSGRLRIVALACAVGVIYAARFQRRWVKVAIIVAVPAALTWLANERLELQESLATGSSAGRTGLESMITPLRVFSQLLSAQHEQGFALSHGYNMLSVPALVIPQSIWPSQPRALGYELVAISAPERYGPDSNYSVVATSTGEAVYNFGWWGIPLAIVIVALALRFLDDRLIRHLEIGKATIVGLLGVVLLAMLAGAMADYTWSGVHTYVARTLTRLPLFFIVLAMAGVHHKLSSRPPKRANFYTLEPLTGRVMPVRK